MTYSIETKYFGPGNVRGARIRVKSNWDTKWYEYDHAARDPHVVAASQFLNDTMKVRAGMTPRTNHCDNVRGDGIVMIVWCESQTEVDRTIILNRDNYVEAINAFNKRGKSSLKDSIGKALRSICGTDTNDWFNSNDPYVISQESEG